MKDFIECEKLIFSFDQLTRLYGSDFILYNIRVSYIEEEEEYWVYYPIDYRGSLISIPEFKTAVSIDGPHPVKINFFTEAKESEGTFNFIGSSIPVDTPNYMILKFKKLFNFELEVFEVGEENKD